MKRTLSVIIGILLLGVFSINSEAAGTGGFDEFGYTNQSI